MANPSLPIASSSACGHRLFCRSSKTSRLSAAWHGRRLSGYGRAAGSGRFKALFYSEGIIRVTPNRV